VKKKAKAPCVPVSTRSLLIEHAIRIYAKRGIVSATFQEIADSAGLSQAAVFYHFPNREELLSAVLEEVVQRNHLLALGQADPRDDARERLRKHFGSNLRWGVEFPEQAQVLIFLYALASGSAEFSEKYRRLLETARERVLAILLAGERERLWKLDSKPEPLAELLHDIMVGIFTNTLAVLKSAEPSTYSKVIANCEKKWIRVLEGMGLGTSASKR
jgi:AcrR family transcriptional regulator